VIGLVDEWIDWQEEKARLEEEDRAQWRAERKAVADSAAKQDHPDVAGTVGDQPERRTAP
jgi:hypothetical protein